MDLFNGQHYLDAQVLLVLFKSKRIKLRITTFCLLIIQIRPNNLLSNTMSVKQQFDPSSDRPFPPSGRYPESKPYSRKKGITPSQTFDDTQTENKIQEITLSLP